MTTFIDLRVLARLLLETNSGVCSGSAIGLMFRLCRPWIQIAKACLVVLRFDVGWYYRTTLVMSVRFVIFAVTGIG
jgi:hypothetical protein